MLMQSINRKPRLVKKISGTYANGTTLFTLSRQKKYLIFWKSQNSATEYAYLNWQFGSDNATANYYFQFYWVNNTSLQSSSANGQRIGVCGVSDYSVGYTFIDGTAKQCITNINFVQTSTPISDVQYTCRYVGNNTGDITIFVYNVSGGNYNVEMVVYEV